MVATQHRASCCCGATYVEAEGAPAFNGICHCVNCQQRTGSAFGWSVYFPADQVKNIGGPLASYELRHQGSGTLRQARRFCTICGTTLCWEVADWPDHIGIAGGCFAPGSLPAPTQSVSETTRHAWISLPKTWERGA